VNLAIGLNVISDVTEDLSVVEESLGLLGAPLPLSVVGLGGVPAYRIVRYGVVAFVRYRARLLRRNTEDQGR
jgi:hypothetical protein